MFAVSFAVSCAVSFAPDVSCLPITNKPDALSASGLLWHSHQRRLRWLWHLVRDLPAM